MRRWDIRIPFDSKLFEPSEHDKKILAMARRCGEFQRELAHKECPGCQGNGDLHSCRAQIFIGSMSGVGSATGRTVQIGAPMAKKNKKCAKCKRERCCC
jgi:hypothetical protein